MGDVPSATAILDRFLHHAEIITMNGRSYRLRNQPGQAAKDEQAPKEKEEKNSKEDEKPTKEAKPSRRTAETVATGPRGTCLTKFPEKQFLYLWPGWF